MMGRAEVAESEVIHGIGASPGRAFGLIHRVQWGIDAPPHRTIEAADIDAEVARFEEARAWACERIRDVRSRTAKSVGDVEAKIFDPQILMLEDPDLVEGTIRYIRENFLAAERAFDWRLTEIRTQILDAAHLMVVDRLADLQDIRQRVLSRLVGEEDDPLILPDEPGIFAFEELTPGVAVQLDPTVAVGLITRTGSRTAHSAIVARSLEIPAVVGVGKEIGRIRAGSRALIDGGTGRVILDPNEREIGAHRVMVERLSAWRDRPSDRPRGPVQTADGASLHLRANIDQPHDVAAARRVSAEGVGLFRSEFLVIGRRIIPSEEEQYLAYRQVVESFPRQPVTLRTFDIGGDKFPLFLEMPPEENPYLGWRAIRVCLDRPDLFRNQLRAAIRAGQDGRQMRILVPFVISESEVVQTREILEEVQEDLGVEAPVPLGVMVETPALGLTLDVVGPLLDFISLGTNDLTQYALAIDRGNARLQHLADPLHPALVRLYRRIFRAAAEIGLDVSVCGDLPTNPLGLALLVGIGYRDFSLAPPSIPEVRELLSLLSTSDLHDVVGDLQDREAVVGLPKRLRAYLDDLGALDSTTF